MRALVLLLISLVIVLPNWTPARAETPPATIMIESESTEVSFPEGITFQLKGTSDVAVARAELLYRRAAEETLHLTEADIAPSTTLDITHFLDLRVYYAPPGIDVTYYWRLVSENGGSFETPAKTILWSDTRFEWTEQTDGKISVFSYSGDPGFDQYVLETARETLEQLEGDWGAAITERIRIWIYSSRNDFAGARAPNSEPWSIGLAMPHFQVIIAAIEPGDEWSVGRTIPHEVSHQVLHQAARNPFNAPATWFNEGLAGLAQWEGTDNFDEVVAEAAEEGRLLSLRSLVSQFPYDSEGISLAYAQSALVTRFIAERWGEEAIRSIITAYTAGVSHDNALLAALGVDTEGLDALWRENLERNGQTIAPTRTSEANAAGIREQLVIESSAIILTLAAGVGILRQVRRRRTNAWSESTDDNIFAA